MVETKQGLSIIVSGFIAIIVGVVFAGVIADNIYETRNINSIDNESVSISTTDLNIVNESISIASGLGQTGNVSVISVTYFGNVSNCTGGVSGNATIGIDVNWTLSGAVRVSQNIFADGTYNISYTYATLGTGEVSQDDVTSVSFFGDGNISTGWTDIEINDEINVTKATGVLKVSTLNFTAGDYNVSYEYEPSLYVTNSTARTILSLVTLFFVLGVLGIGFIIVKKSFPDLF